MMPPPGGLRVADRAGVAVTLAPGVALAGTPSVTVGVPVLLDVAAAEGPGVADA